MVKSERVTALLLSSQSIRGELKMKDLTRQDVLDRWIKSQGDMTLTPDHPDRKTTADELLEYAVTNKYDDLVTVDSNGTRNGAVRVIKKEFVESGMMSRRVGSYLDNCTNIHSEEDLKLAEINIKNAEIY